MQDSQKNCCDEIGFEKSFDKTLSNKPDPTGVFNTILPYFL